jgi:hypothetical protein
VTRENGPRNARDFIRDSDDGNIAMHTLLEFIQP